jgi:hypothetical protein
MVSRHDLLYLHRWCLGVVRKELYLIDCRISKEEINVFLASGSIVGQLIFLLLVFIDLKR